MSVFWRYTITIFCSLSLFGTHFLSFSYPYLALGIYLIWVGINIFSINFDFKINTELIKQLEKALKLSKNTIEKIEETEKYKNYLEVISAQMLMNLQKFDSSITLNAIIKEITDNAKKDNEKVR